jgi:hypothetical protein
VFLPQRVSWAGCGISLVENLACLSRGRDMSHSRIETRMETDIRQNGLTGPRPELDLVIAVA